MPLLEWDPPEEADLLTAKDVMSRNLIVLREQESVEFVVKVCCVCLFICTNNNKYYTTM